MVGTGPSEQAGLMLGDEIVAVQGKSVLGLGMDSMVACHTIQGRALLLARIHTHSHTHMPTCARSPARSFTLRSARTHLHLVMQSPLHAAACLARSFLHLGVSPEGSCITSVLPLGAKGAVRPEPEPRPRPATVITPPRRPPSSLYRPSRPCTDGHGSGGGTHWIP
jgi:hypothetical protein